MISAPCHINYEPFLIARKSEKMPASLAELLRKSSRYCRHERVGKWNGILFGLRADQKKIISSRKIPLFIFFFVAMSQHHIFRWHVAFAPNNILIKKKNPLNITICLLIFTHGLIAGRIETFRFHMMGSNSLESQQEWTHGKISLHGTTTKHAFPALESHTAIWHSLPRSSGLQISMISHSH